MGRLEGKVAIITGAASGMGREIAILFAKEGAKVMVADIAVDDGEETVRMAKESGGEATFVKTDISSATDVEKMVKATVDTYGKLNVLINCAAIAAFEGSTVDCKEETWDKIIAVDLKGTWLIMKHTIPEMVKVGGGSIVNFSSDAGRRGLPEIPSYAAAKGGVISLSRTAAVEFGSKKVRVNCISPGPIATPMVKDQQTPETIARFAKATPLGRIGEPEEVARVALFLASDESSWVNNHCLVVDGGMSATHP